MKLETRINALKELEKLEKKHSKDYCKSHWVSIILGTCWLIMIFLGASEMEKRPLFYFACMVPSVWLIIYGLYKIIRFKINSKFILLFNAVLETNDIEHSELESRRD